MELDDIKKTWGEMNAKLDQQHKLNEQMIKKMMREKSGNKLKTLAFMEYGNLSFFAFLFIFCIPRYHILVLPAEKISFFIMLAIAVVGGIFSVLLIRKVDKIRYFKVSVVEALRLTNELKLLFSKNKMIAYFTYIPFVPSFLIVLDKMLFHRGILEHLSYFIKPLIFGVVLGIFLMYLIYKKLYEQKIDEAEDMLNDLNKGE
jgi:hypothetical protein